MTLYDKVKKLAENIGLNISALEKKAGIANGTIAGWDNAKRGPYAESLKKVADVLNVKIEELL